MGKFFHSSNTTCPAAPTSEAPNPFLGSLTFQHLITWVVLGFTGLTVAISLVTIFRHLFHYTYPTEQRQIVRIVFTPVVFSALSIFSIISYSASKYLLPIQEVYENFALASLFLLFVNYVSPDPHTRGPFFEQLGSPPKKGEAVSSGSRFAWFKKIWISIFLNAVAGAILGVVEIASQAAGTYCETSNNIHFAHIWIRILSTGLLTLAVVGTLRFYGRFKQDMAAHKPLLKLVSFKTIVFVNTIQTLIISFLTGSHGTIKGGDKVTFLDVTIGIPGLLVCIEQVIFSVLMYFAFGTREYNAGGSPALRKRSFPQAVTDALSPADLIRGIADAVGYLLGKSSHSSVSAEYGNIGGAEYRRSYDATHWPGGQDISLGAMDSPTASASQARDPPHQDPPLPDYGYSQSHEPPLLQAPQYHGGWR